MRNSIIGIVSSAPSAGRNCPRPRSPRCRGTLYCKNHALERGANASERRDGRDGGFLYSGPAGWARWPSEKREAAKNSTRDDARDVKSTTTTMAKTMTVSEASRRVNALLVRVRCERCERAAINGRERRRRPDRGTGGVSGVSECGTTLSLTTFVTCDGEVYCAKDGFGATAGEEREAARGRRRARIRRRRSSRNSRSSGVSRVKQMRSNRRRRWWRHRRRSRGGDAEARIKTDGGRDDESRPVTSRTRPNRWSRIRWP